jgi:hypothetical protein
VLASAVALGINLMVVPYLQTHEVPYLSQTLNVAIEWETETAIDLGILAADTLTGTDRSAPRLPQGMSVIGLNPQEASALMESVRKSEAPGYTTVNWAGYHGQWQFGAEALVTVGLVKRGAFEAALRNGTLRGNGGWIGQKQWLRNPANWTVAGGLDTFLNNKNLQDSAFIRLCNTNIQDGFRMRVLSYKTPAHKIAGWAKAAHLKGTDAAKRWYKYRRDSKDGNQTRVSTYALQAERAVLGIQSTAQAIQATPTPFTLQGA